MTVTVKDFGDAVIYLGAIAAALAAIGIVVRWAVVGPLKKWLREQIQPAVNETRDAATAVQAEVSPNGGSSMKDAVTRMDVELRSVSQRLTDHITNHPGS